MMDIPSADFFFNKESKWQLCYEELRQLILPFKLEEEVKWGKPCYTLDGQNVVLIHGFKDYCALLFHKGVLIKDPENQMVQQTENVQVQRQLRFVSLEDVKGRASYIKACIEDAIRVEKSGEQFEMKKTADFEMVEEFESALKENPDLKKAFDSLTPGRQRGYLLHFSQAKQSKTRQARIEKYWDHILAGKGLND